MAQEIIVVKGADESPIFGNVWKAEDSKKVKGNIVIVHGMAEYSARYAGFATFLNINGFNVYAVDHIGHGLNVSKKSDTPYTYGVWPKDGFDKCVEQIFVLVKYIKAHSEKPIVLFGHSMGSFIAQAFYQKHSELLNGVVFCGSAGNNATYKESRILTHVMYAFKSKKAKNNPSNFINKLSNQTFNKGVAEFKDGYKTDFKWLSYNEDNVRQYDLDPECGYPCSFMYYYSFFNGINKIYKKSALNNIKNKCNIMIVSGAEDPVGGCGKYVKTLANFYLKSQSNVELKIYGGFRHEILNETGHEKVYKDLLEFFDKSIVK
jgi:alpha-beta hydrolase superfamily lysophospholipase